MEKVAGRGPVPGSAPPDASPRSIVTICAECKQVIGLLDRAGRPRTAPPVEDALVSHGICEACARRLYGKIFNRDG